DLSTSDLVEYSIFVTVGCAWYTLLSLSLSQFMPYRLAQQELAEGIREVATFIRIKSEFYDLNSDTDKSFSKMIDQQIIINTHLRSLREILFKSKLIVKDSTSIRSEEHTSELQSRENLVCRLLLERKKMN